MSYILMVEDSAIVAFMLRSQLKQLTSVEIVIEHDSKNAFAQLDRGTPALAFLDAQLDGETSFGIAERLLKLKVPTFFVTAYSKESLKAKGMSDQLACIPLISKTDFASKAREALSCLDGGSDTDADR